MRTSLFSCAHGLRERIVQSFVVWWFVVWWFVVWSFVVQSFMVQWFIIRSLIVRSFIGRSFMVGSVSGRSIVGCSSVARVPSVAARALAALVVLTVVTAVGRPAAAQDLLIRNATVLTVTDGTHEGADILVRDGKIAQIGSGLSAPQNVQTIDATGRYVMPGIIDAHSHIAISSINEGTAPATPEVNVGDVLEPYDIALYRALAGGVTTSHLMHGSANVIGGQGETVKHRYGVRDPDSLVFEGAARTVKFALGENPTRVHGNRGAQDNDANLIPRTRMGVEFVIRDAFSRARHYMDAQVAYERERRTNERAVPPPHSERLEVLADILRGEIIVHTHSYRADEILMLLDVLEDFGVDRIVFQHVNEGFKVAPELAAYGAMASVFSDWWAYKFEVYYSTAYNAAILTRNGVVTSINSDSPELIRHLYHETAKTQKYGDLTDDEALALITINPARQLGIEDRVGSISVGKDADLAVFNAHPLSIYAVPQQTIVDGVVRFDIDEDPDDMRLLADPSEDLDTASLDGADRHQCLDGAFFRAAAAEVW